MRGFRFRLLGLVPINNRKRVFARNHEPLNAVGALNGPRPQSASEEARPTPRAILEVESKLRPTAPNEVENRLVIDR
jgi:hypothetical protein